MRVAMLVGVLMYNVIAGLYGSNWGDSSLSAGFSADAGQVQAYDGEVPPPPSWP